MKRIYEVRVERRNNMDAYVYNVVATHGVEAGRRAMVQVKRDSGFKRDWRVTHLTEIPGYVIP